MARLLRIEYPGMLYHVTARGMPDKIFIIDNEDRQQFLAVLSSVVSRFQLLLPAYCLIDNHFHLLVETLEENLSKAMRLLNGVCTQAFNHCHQPCAFSIEHGTVTIGSDTFSNDATR